MATERCAFHRCDNDPGPDDEDTVSTPNGRYCNRDCYGEAMRFKQKERRHAHIARWCREPNDDHVEY